MFVADRDRIKSFSWAERKGIPVHTLNSLKSHKGPLAILPNGRLIRAGQNSALLWNLDSLETHGPGPKFKRIGQVKYSWANCMRDLPSDDDEEYSTGSKPHVSIPFANKYFSVNNWHLHKLSLNMLCVEDPSLGYGCISLDIEHGGTTAARYLGHGGAICDFSTSEGDPNTILTAAADGYARLFDVRQPLPVLTFDVEKHEAPVVTVVLTHLDGLPGEFRVLSTRSSYLQVNVIDRSDVLRWSGHGGYQVLGHPQQKDRVRVVHWQHTRDGTRLHNATLYAATECEYKDWLGGYHGYREFNHEIIEGFDIKPPILRRETEVFWPDRAIHIENAFGYAYDAGDQVLRKYSYGQVDFESALTRPTVRYAFKDKPAPDVLPEYGPGEMMDPYDMF